MQYMLDTCVINHVIEEKRILNAILNSNVNPFITYVQQDELDAMKAKWSSKHSEAMDFLNLIQVKNEPTSVAVLGVLKLGCSRLGKGNAYNYVLKYMQSQKTRKDYSRDAIIADSAHTYGMKLVTDDGLLIEAYSSFGGDVVTLDEFVKILSNS